MISSASGLAGASEPCANEAVSQMPDSLTISLKGDSVGLGDLTEALGDFTAVLGEVERDVTGRRDIEWKLTALERASATVGVTPVQPQGVLLDQRAEVIRAVVAGLGTLTERPGSAPAFQRSRTCLYQETCRAKERSCFLTLYWLVPSRAIRLCECR